MRKRVLIADDSENIRYAIRTFVKDVAEIEICGEAADGLEAIKKAIKLKPDLVLLDLSMPIGDSDEADRHSDLIAITVPGWIRSVVGAKRRWRMDFAESDRDRQACCC